MQKRRLIVTHHAPDLDAIGSVWLLKKFDTQDFGDAKVAFVNPGSLIEEYEIEQLGIDERDVRHVDTGLGEFDHHQKERASTDICASSLVHDHLIQIHPELEEDQALDIIVKFITEIDHFGEIYWPEAESYRYSFMIHELIRGNEFSDPHDDESQLHFGMKCLDYVYATITQQVKANEIINEKGKPFDLPQGKCLALETRNDDTIKSAQKQGFVLVVKKNPKLGNIRIKARPDVNIDLSALSEKISARDTVGDWFLHSSGKMLLNGSIKNKDQKASPLTLDEITALIIDTYGKK
ncbi:MAG: hypothetical protein GW762_01220 [Candidatus Pacebacteria bacterium]|nr:hypothetical protein [Candidatus Paceibacterota bacterium]